MAVYGYTRVSTAKQSEEGESLEVQQRTLHGYAMMHGMEIEKVFVERAVSGSVPLADRPEGGALLGVLKAGDVVLTAKLDRMFRSALDALEVLAKFKAMGVSLHMIDLGGDVTSNGISKLVFTILSAVAEAERDRIRERITQVKRDQKQRGRYLGGRVPFGYRPTEDGLLEIVPEEQAAMQKAHEMRAQGVVLRDILAALEAAGTKMSMGGLHRLLRGSEEVLAA